MPSMSITIVSHCYCPPQCDLYAQHLKWQFASLVRFPPKVEVRYIVCHGSVNDDVATNSVVASLRHAEVSPSLLSPKVKFVPLAVSLPLLLRRAVMRNIVALECQTDICWFCDLDYVFGPRCLDTLAECVGPDDELCCPDMVLENESHEIGDAMIADNRERLLPKINERFFRPRYRTLAIGGLQIVGGNVARERGYLSGTKWTKPIDTTKGWHQTHEDRAFRKGRKTKLVTIPNLYWIRHAARVANDYQGDS